MRSPSPRNMRFRRLRHHRLSPPHMPRTGHDLISLMFNFLDACLYAFASGELIVKDFALLQLAVPGVDTGEAPVADAAVDAAAAPSAVPTAAAAGAGAAAATPAVAAAPSSSPTFLIRVAWYVCVNTSAARICLCAR